MQFVVSAPPGVEKRRRAAESAFPCENGLAPAGGQPLGNLGSIREVPRGCFIANLDRPLFSTT